MSTTRRTWFGMPSVRAGSPPNRQLKPGSTPRCRTPVPPQRATPPSSALPLPTAPRTSIPPGHPFGADARCVVWTILKNGVRAVPAGWGKRPRSAGNDEAAELLDLVASAIHQAYFAASTAPVRPKVDPRIHSALGRRLLELLR